MGPPMSVGGNLCPRRLAVSITLYELVNMASGPVLAYPVGLKGLSDEGYF